LTTGSRVVHGDQHHSELIDFTVEYPDRKDVKVDLGIKATVTAAADQKKRSAVLVQSAGPKVAWQK
jgi:hypothetical protein